MNPVPNYILLYYAIWIALNVTFECKLSFYCWTFWIPSVLTQYCDDFYNFRSLPFCAVYCALWFCLFSSFQAEHFFFFLKEKKNLLWCRCWSESIGILGHLLSPHCMCGPLIITVQMKGLLCIGIARRLKCARRGICHTLLQYPLPLSEITYMCIYTHVVSNTEAAA